MGVPRIWGLVCIAALAAPTLLGQGADLVPRLLKAAHDQTTQSVRYDGAYRRIGYPGGDVPANIGVCTDVVVRAYRAVDVDLQVLVHEDMSRAFSSYPRAWGLAKPDSNIDHRRVPNLRTFFKRRGASLEALPRPGATCRATW